MTNLYFKRKIKKFSSPWVFVKGTFFDNRLTGKATIRYSNGAELEGEPNSTKEETMKFIDELDSTKVIAALEQSFAPKFQQELGTQRSLEA